MAARSKLGWTAGMRRMWGNSGDEVQPDFSLCPGRSGGLAGVWDLSLPTAVPLAIALVWWMGRESLADRHGPTALYLAISIFLAMDRLVDSADDAWTADKPGVLRSHGHDGLGWDGTVPCCRGAILTVAPAVYDDGTTRPTRQGRWVCVEVQCGRCSRQKGEVLIVGQTPLGEEPPAGAAASRPLQPISCACFGTTRAEPENIAEDSRCGRRAMPQGRALCAMQV